METWIRKDNSNVAVEVLLLNEDNVVQAAQWCDGELIEEIDPIHPEEMQWGINVRVLGGDTRRATLGMYLGKFGRGFFVAHNRVFEEMYKPRDHQSPPPTSIGEARRALGFADPFDRGRTM